MPYTALPDNAITLTADGAELLVAWRSAAPAGTAFQVYVAGKLAWHGPGRLAHLPYPSGLGPNVRVDVGSVGPGEDGTDFAAGLGIPADRAVLTWYGGSWEAPDLAGFRVYRSPAAGAAVDYGAPAATLPAYTAGQMTDGYGLGPYGVGPFGASSGTYSWTSPRLGGGAWNFGVRPFDAAGNEGEAREAAVTIAAPPRPPAADARGRRLTYTYDSASRVVTLHWLPSPG